MRSPAATRTWASDVRRMRRPADAVGAQVHLANLGMDAEDQLDRAGEIERIVEVAGRAMTVIADRPERVHDLARDPADRAEQVPEQHEQPLARAVEARGDERVGIELQAPRQGQGPDPRDFGVGGLARNSPSRSTTAGSTPSGTSRSSACSSRARCELRELHGLLEGIDACPSASLPVTAASIRR